MEQKTITIPACSLTNLIHDYAQALYLTRSRGSSYQQGKEDALMSAINYCFGLTSVEVREREDFKQAYIDIRDADMSASEE